jgi:S-disulfanyl-L-cysteine oxidoreductase SoxD
MANSRMHSRARRAAFLVCFSATLVLADSVDERIGHTPTSEELREWKVPVLPDGTGLPAGSGNAIGGEKVFLSKCAACHGNHGEGRDPLGPMLVGGIGSLRTRNPMLTVGSYWPYSTSLWDYVQRAMPYPRPGTLTADDTYAVTAYVLYLNGLIKKKTPMNQQTLPRVKMPNRDGFEPDTRPDVHSDGARAVGCKP